MKLVDAPQHLPGCCMVCGTTPPGPYVDLERRSERGWAYLCMACARTIGGLALQGGRKKAVPKKGE